MLLAHHAHRQRQKPVHVSACVCVFMVCCMWLCLCVFIHFLKTLDKGAQQQQHQQPVSMCKKNTLATGNAMCLCAKKTLGTGNDMCLHHTSFLPLQAELESVILSHFPYSSTFV